MLSRSINTKLSFYISALILTCMAIMSMAFIIYLERQIKNIISDQQFQLIKEIASGFDDKIITAERTLLALAKDISPEALKKQEIAQRFLDKRSDVKTIFDNGIFLLSAEGKIFVESPYASGSRGLDLSFREYFKKTIATSKPYISSPFLSKQPHRHPVIVFTAPIFNAEGKTAAVLVGSLDLMNENFVGKLGRIKIGETGYLALTNSERILIMHPDKQRILTKVPVGVNKLFDRAIDGFDGTDENINSRGVHLLSSYVHLKKTDWILTANYPTIESYSSVRKAKKYLCWATALVAILSIMITRFIMKKLTAPLLLFTKHVETLSDKEGNEKLSRINTGDEIETLAKAFNKMVATLDKKRERLRDQIYFLQNLIDAIPTPVYYKDTERAYQGCNKAFESFIGLAKDNIISRTVYDIAPHYFASAIHKADTELFEKCKSHTYEHNIALNDGTCREIIINKAPFYNAEGSVSGVIGTIFDITELKQAEVALKRSEALYKSVVDNIAIGIAIINPNMEIVSVNEQVKKWLPAINIEDKPLCCKIFVDQSCKDICLDCPVAKTLKDGNIHETEKNVKIEGKIRYLKIVASALKDDHGEIIAAIKMVEDITTRRQYENALRESEAKYRTVFENTGTATIIINEDTTISLANNTYAKYTGYTKQELEGKKSWTEFTSSADLERMVNCHKQRRIDPASAPDSYEFLFVDRYGNTRNFVCNVAMIPGTKQSVASCMDITERKRAEEALMESEEKYRVVFETTGSPTIIVDEDTTISLVNNKFVEMFGLSKDEIEGKKSWVEYIVPSDLKRMLDYHKIRRINPDEPPITYEFSCFDKDGNVRNMISTVAMIPGTNKSVSSHIDITERKCAEEALLNYQMQLKVLAAELSNSEEKERRRIATELHDNIGQTLALCSLKLSSQAFASQSEVLVEAIEEIKEMIDSSIEAIRSLTLQISPPLLYEVGLEAALEWLCKWFKKEYNYHVAFWDDGRTKYLDDAIRSTIYQVVRELLLNAVKHANVKFAQIRLTKDSDKIIIEVKDDGIGYDYSKVIDNRDIKRGFGLFNIRQRIEHLGGEFIVETELTKGTYVKLSVPLIRDK